MLDTCWVKVTQLFRKYMISQAEVAKANDQKWQLSTQYISVSTYPHSHYLSEIGIIVHSLLSTQKTGLDVNSSFKNGCSRLSWNEAINKVFNYASRMFESQDEQNYLHVKNSDIQNVALRIELFLFMLTWCVIKVLILLADLTASKRSANSYQKQVYFAVVNHVYLLFSFEEPAKI